MSTTSYCVVLLCGILAVLSKVYGTKQNVLVTLLVGKPEGLNNHSTWVRRRLERNNLEVWVQGGMTCTCRGFQPRSGAGRPVARLPGVLRNAFGVLQRRLTLHWLSGELPSPCCLSTMCAPMRQACTRLVLG